MTEHKEIWPPEVTKTVRNLKKVCRVLKDSFTRRDEAIDLLVLATICREHLLLLGPPGTAKTQIITQFKQLIDADEFQYLLTKFTEPSEIFGPLDVGRFKKGEYVIRTDSMLPTAQIAFLDEVFQGSSAILNSLLTILNERQFHNGSDVQRVPLISLVGASNQLPDDPWLQAFADRFVLRLVVEPVEDDQLHDLLIRGWDIETDQIEAAERRAAGKAEGKSPARVDVKDIIDLYFRLREVHLTSLRHEYEVLISELKSEGIRLSDRRIVKGQVLIAGAALMRESRTADVQDMWPLLYIWDRPEEAEAVRRVVQPRIATASGESFSNKRPVSEILNQLKTLHVQAQTVTRETAMTSHLSAMNKLRREMICDHPDETEPRHQIENAINQLLKRLEMSYV